MLNLKILKDEASQATIKNLYLNDNNLNRYVFRMYGKMIEEKHGINSNKMVESDTFELDMSVWWDINLEEFLINEGYLKSFKTRHRHYKYASITTTEYFGLTPKGWEIYKKDKAKNNY